LTRNHRFDTADGQAAAISLVVAAIGVRSRRQRMQATVLGRLLGSDRNADGGALAGIVEAARSAWPTVELAADVFIAHLADRLTDTNEIEAALRRMHTSDLYLACACLHGDAGAIAAFDLHCLTVVDRALPRLGMDPDTVGEVKQRLRRNLLVADTGPPRIAGFAGRGDLRSWIRVLAVHEALAIARKAQREITAGEDRLVDLACVGASPELDYFKRVYRREFEIAFREAVQALSDRDRILVRQHFLDGVSVNDVARLYRVHRATAGRWLERARDALLAATRARLMDRLDIPPAEIESILRLILSRLEISLRPLFRQRRS
jgi:RNA polymerase sigma-70 factor (ECF subfamily)